MLPHSRWYYRRRSTWVDNLSLPQAFGTTVLSLLALPLFIGGAVLGIYFFLAYVAFNKTFWVILVIFSIWCLTKSK